MAGHRKLGRSTDKRMAILRGLVTDVLKYGRVETTLMRAKESRKIVDKIITLGKKGDLHARKQALSFVYDTNTVHRLFEEIAPRYKERNGGYTRIYKLAPRRGDGSEMAILELVEYDASSVQTKPKKKRFSRSKKTEEINDAVDASEEVKNSTKESAKKSVKEKAEEKIEDLKDSAEIVEGEAKEATKEVKEKIKKVTDDAKEKAEEVVEGLKEETEK